MTYMTHDVQVGQEYWMRCPMCGDSQKNKNKSHWSINIFSGKHYCFRCGYHGRFSHDQIFQTIGEYFFSPVANDDTYSLEQRYHLLEWSMQPGAGSPRFSTLERGHLETRLGNIDVIPTRDYGGTIVGYNCRPTWAKIAFTVGSRGLGYSGNTIPQVARIVEGPYDALYAEDVVTFGLPSAYQWNLLRGCQLILCPDSDVWERPDLALRYITAARKTGWVKHVEWLPPGTDPDEIPVEDRECIGLGEAIRRLNRLRMKRERSLSASSPVDVPRAWTIQLEESSELGG